MPLEKMGNISSTLSPKYLLWANMRAYWLFHIELVNQTEDRKSLKSYNIYSTLQLTLCCIPPVMKRLDIYIYIYIYSIYWTSPCGNTRQDEPDMQGRTQSDVLLWTPTHGLAKAGRPARTYIQQLCEDTGCCPEDLPRAMNNREKWRERVRDIRATSVTWWWWWYIYSHPETDLFRSIRIYQCG